MAITAASAATSARAPYFRLRCELLIRRSCSAQESCSGSVCCLTISKTSLRSGMGASRSAKSGPALRGEGADGRWTYPHDPCGLPRVVVVQIEQEEGGTLPRSQGEEHLANVFAQLHLVEGVVHDPERYPSAGGQPRGAHPHPAAVQRHLEQVGMNVADLTDRVPALPHLQERLVHEVGCVVTISGDEVERLEQAPMLVLVERPEVAGSPRDHLQLDLTLCPHHLSTMSGPPPTLRWRLRMA